MIGSYYNEEELQEMVRGAIERALKLRNQKVKEAIEKIDKILLKIPSDQWEELAKYNDDTHIILQRVGTKMIKDMLIKELGL